MTLGCCISWWGLGSRILFVIAVRYEAITNYASLLCKFALYSMRLLRTSQ